MAEASLGLDNYYENLRRFIKRSLKQKKITYSELATKLNKTETTIKRWMTNQNIRLSDLQAIAKALHIELEWPANFGTTERVRPSHYTLKQEQFFAKNPKPFLMFIKLLVGHNFESVLQECQINVEQGIRYLRQMENLSVLELWPSNVIKMKMKPPFRWRVGGPIQTTYQQKLISVLIEHLRKKFPQSPNDDGVDPSGFLWPFETYMCKETSEAMVAELHNLLRKYRTLASTDKASGNKVVPVSILVGLDNFDAWKAILGK